MPLDHEVIMEEAGKWGRLEYNDDNDNSNDKKRGGERVGQ